MSSWLMRKERRHIYALIAADALVATFSMAAATSLRVSWTHQWPRSIGDPAALLTFVALVMTQIVFAYVFGLYEREPRRRGIELARCIAASLGTVTAGALLFFVLRPELSRTALLAYAPFAATGLYLRRVALPQRGTPAPARIASVGLGATDRPLVRELEELGHCEHVVDVSTDAWEGGREGTLARHIGAHGDIDTLVVGTEARLPDDALIEMLSLRLAGIEIAKVPVFFARRTGRFPLTAVDAEWLCDAAVPRSLSRRARRAFEAIAALALMLAGLPVGILIALAIKVESRGPVIFRQPRLGLEEQPFVLYKFRTMREGAEDASGPVWSSTGDPRVTRLGAFLRARGLDELPQLWNVLRGELSFIGVRPIRRHFADLLATEVPLYRARFLIRPGITGWAQVQHDYAGSRLGQRRKLEYELFYLRYSSPALDALILIKTLRKLFLRQVGETRRTQPAGDLTRG